MIDRTIDEMYLDARLASQHLTEARTKLTRALANIDEAMILAPGMGILLSGPLYLAGIVQEKLAFALRVLQSAQNPEERKE